MDFYDGQDVYPRIAEELKDLEIGVLGKQISVRFKSIYVYYSISPLCSEQRWDLALPRLLRRCSQTCTWVMSVLQSSILFSMFGAGITPLPLE